MRPAIRAQYVPPELSGQSEGLFGEGCHQALANGNQGCKPGEQGHLDRQSSDYPEQILQYPKTGRVILRRVAESNSGLPKGLIRRLSSL